MQSKKKTLIMTTLAGTVIPPVVGALIGYITNAIAIRMLFRPHKPKYLFGKRIPFTPGIIPKEKGRIAEAIGTVISNNLMSKEVLGKYLLSSEMIAKVMNGVQEFIDKQKNNNDTLEQFLLHYVSKDDIESLAISVNDNITREAHEKVTSPEIGKQAAHAAMDYVAEKFNAGGAQEVLDGLGIMSGIKGAVAMLFGKDVITKFLSLLREPAENYLAGNINNMLQKNGDEIISNLIGNETDKILSKPVKDILRGKDEQLVKITSSVVSVYTTIIQEHLPKILENIDISQIVRDRINEMDMDETERLILQVMDKELKAVIWLGALLGLIMGCFNIFV